MQLQGISFVCLLVGLTVGQPTGYAQAGKQPVPVANQILFPDSIGRVLDSMEVGLLKTTQSYSQIERLLASFSPTSVFLDSLPAVLPVEVPIEQFRISSPFGTRQHPILGQTRFHAGVDVKAPLGMIVKATAPGLVAQVGYDPQLGAYVRIQHAFGFETTYGHLSGYCVRPDQLVARNEQIGKVGHSGLATGSHLHYTLKKNGSVIDPFQFCFLLRRRLWLYSASREAASGRSASNPASSLSSEDSYPSSRN